MNYTHLDPASVRVLVHLNQCLDHIEPINTKLIDQYIIRVDRSIVDDSKDEYLAGFLPTINNLLKSPQYLLIDEDYVICKLLRAILSNLSFEKILKLYPLEYMLEAIDSSFPQVQIVVLEILAKSQPVDILANNEIFLKMIKLFIDSETPVEVVNAIESTIVHLMSGDLIRRRFVSSEITNMLKKMKSQGDTTQKARLMDLIVAILPYFPEDHLSSDLYQYTEQDAFSDDVMFVIMLIKFYSDLLNVVLTSYPDKSYILTHIEQQIVLLCELYSQKDSNEDVESFYVNELVHFLSALSNVDLSLFKLLDNKYHLLDELNLREESGVLFLTLVNSMALIGKDEFVQSIPVSSKTIQVIGNLVSNDRTYGMLKDNQLSAEKLKNLPMDLLLKIILSLIKYDYSVDHLLHHLPSIMSILLDRDSPIISPEVFRLKREVLGSLLSNYSKDKLNVWYEEIKQNYDDMISGKKVAAIPTIYDESA